MNLNMRMIKHRFYVSYSHDKFFFYIYKMKENVFHITFLFYSINLFDPKFWSNMPDWVFNY